jgi:hypothetical protein
VRINGERERRGVALIERLNEERERGERKPWVLRSSVAENCGYWCGELV